MIFTGTIHCIYTHTYYNICRDEYYQKKMEEQFDELNQLKDEKRRLLAIQGQLQELHDRFQQVKQMMIYSRT